MRHHAYLTVVSFVFFVVGLLHLGRIVWSWPASIDGFRVPLWYSWIICPLAFYLAWQGFHFYKKLKR